MKYKHTHTSFVEAPNKIFPYSRFKMLKNDPEKVSATWGKHLCGLIDELNNTKNEMIGMKPKDTIK